MTREQLYAARMAICGACPKFDALLKRCKGCGCFLVAKARIRTARCPLDKWPKPESK